MTKTYTLSTVLASLSYAIAKAGSQRKWAETAQVSHVWVSQVIARQCPPGPRILRALGYETVETLYRKVSR